MARKTRNNKNDTAATVGYEAQLWQMPRTSWADMARYELVRPPKPIAASFTKMIWPSVERTVAGVQESSTLATLRDRLLPKLISGGLRLRDAERIAAGVVA